jgi:methylase of polypeptide subunit release factors
MCAQHCDYVLALDINPRAVHFGAMSLAINGVSNAEIRLADLYDGIADRRFDYITANPPFVINQMPTQRFRDGGEYGDEILWRILQGLPFHLTDGGFAQIVTFVHEFRDFSQLEQVRAFAEIHQLQTLIFTSASFDSHELAIGQHLNEIFSSRDDKREFVEYREHLRKLALESCCLAIITFRNNSQFRFKKLCALESAKCSSADLQSYLHEFYH